LVDKLVGICLDNCPARECILMDFGRYFPTFKVKFNFVLMLIGHGTKKTGGIGVTVILFLGVGYGICFGQGAHVRT